MHKNIKDLTLGETISDVYVLSSLSERETAGSAKKPPSPFISITVLDKTGTISGNKWDTKICDVKDLVVGEFVEVNFTVGEYAGKKQMNLKSISLPTTLFDKSEIIPCSEEDPHILYDEIYKDVSDFTSELKEIALMTLKDNKAELLYYPAAKVMHHAYKGGLIEHTNGMFRLAKNIIKNYPEINSELLYTAIILHDIRKPREFELGTIGMVSDYSKEGKLIGHIPMGFEYVGEICRKLSISEETMILLQHMVLSHHGEPIFGSPVVPSFMEAYLLHEIDMIDSRMRVFKDTLKTLNSGEFSDRVFALGNIQVYKPNLE